MIHRLRCTVPTLLLVALVGCSTEKTASMNDSTAREISRAKAAAPPALNGRYEYHFYPEQMVYYSPDRDLYYYYGASFWTVSSRLPSTYDLRLSQRMIIGLDTETPYQQHTMVMNALNGGLGSDAPAAVATVPTEH